MKKYIILITLLTITVIAFAQNQTINGNLTVKNPMTFPCGININVDFSTNWSREFNITHGTKNLFSIGVLATASTLKYGYIGGGINNNTNFQSPWMVFLPNGNVGIGTTSPQYKLQVEGDIYSKNWVRVNGNQGLYFETWGGGFYMIDQTWIRTYNNKNFYHNTGIMRTDGIFHVGPDGNRLIVNTNGNVGIGIINPVATLDVLGTNGSIGNKNFRVLYKNGGALTNTEFSALASIPSLLAGGNTWTALYAKQGSASKAGVFEGDVFITNNVGIGVTNPTSKLEVAGAIRAKEVKIEATGWSDFVFDKSYNLPKLSDVEKHINDKQHLPGIPSEKEVLENGVNVVDMQAKLLQKIEELTLYVIEQQKQLDKQYQQINQLQEQIGKNNKN